MHRAGIITDNQILPRQLVKSFLNSQPANAIKIMPEQDVIEVRSEHQFLFASQHSNTNLPFRSQGINELEKPLDWPSGFFFVQSADVDGNLLMCARGFSGCFFRDLF